MISWLVKISGVNHAKPDFMTMGGVKVLSNLFINTYIKTLENNGMLFIPTCIRILSLCGL